MAEGFRIGRINIEGFKGFTEPKEIDLRKRHVFLLGRNGNGKSSVIEAIRWGLFGSTGRPNDIVANQGYGGRCRVELDLVQDGNEWHLHRNLIRGISGGSDAALFDRDGKEHLIRAVLPQMDSLNAGEGTHIIFAPQSAPLRRQPEDLTPFERTVFGHLGLTHARAMLSHLKSFVEEQANEESVLDERLSDVRKRVDGQIADLERQRGRVLDSPPWDGDRPPSTAETERKVKQLIQEISASGSETDWGQLSLRALVDEAERALGERTGQDRGPLDERLNRLDDELGHLEKVRGAWENVVGQRKDLERAGERLERILDGISSHELKDRVESRRKEAGTQALRRRLGEIAGELLDRTEGDGLVPCPICETDRKRDEFEFALSAMAHAQSEKDSVGLRTIENRWNEAQEIEAEIQGLTQEIERLESELIALVNIGEDDRLAEAVNGGRVTDHIEVVSKQRASIAKQIESFKDWHDPAQAGLLRLREEAQYQQLQRDLRNLGSNRADMERVQRGFEDLIRFGESVSCVCDTVDSTLKQELHKKLPSVAEELTSVFGALTMHPHFDRLVVDEDKLPRLELGVGSSSNLFGVAHPAGVLNGQAQSALELVPYFALSQAEEAPTEVYLVLLDDPTRAFDREHIEILVERLADLGKHVQVIVATQETEAFRELLPRSFEPESYVIVEPRNWSYANGPELVAEYL